MKMFILNSALPVLIFPFSSYGQSFNGRTVLGEQNARQAIKETLANKNNKPFYDTLIKDKETTVGVTEPILFKIYGKENIVTQRPYECF